MRRSGDYWRLGGGRRRIQIRSGFGLLPTGREGDGRLKELCNENPRIKTKRFFSSYLLSQPIAGFNGTRPRLPAKKMCSRGGPSVFGVDV